MKMVNLRSEKGIHIVTHKDVRYIFNSIIDALNYIRKEINYAVQYW